MKLTLTPTNIFTTHNGVAVRVWEGVTEDGVPCQFFVASLRVSAEHDATAFNNALKEIDPPIEIHMRELPPPGLWAPGGNRN
jgi:hypothetical protein